MAEEQHPRWSTRPEAFGSPTIHHSAYPDNHPPICTAAETKVWTALDCVGIRMNLIRPYGGMEAVQIGLDVLNARQFAMDILSRCDDLEAKA